MDEKGKCTMFDPKYDEGLACCCEGTCLVRESDVSPFTQCEQYEDGDINIDYPEDVGISY